MLEFEPDTFGKLNADEYDELHDPGNAQDAVELIHELANGGRVLELAIGTGRIALPLAQTGLQVSGIEGSPDMVEKLRQKPGGRKIPVAIGDFADVDVPGQFDHICLVFNTLFNLASQSDQVRCFKNVAEKLKPGGTFLIEAFVPDLTAFEGNQNVRTKRLDANVLWLEGMVHDPVLQRIEYQRVRLSEAGIKLVPLPLRYAWPAELDLMAQLAGLKRVHRWSDWRKSVFTADSKSHITVYAKAGS